LCELLLNLSCRTAAFRRDANLKVCGADRNASEAALVIALLVSSPTFVTFLIASLVLAVTPGPAVVYLVTQTMGQGRKAGLASVGGIALGNLGNAAVASVGLAAVLAASATAFVVVKFSGAAYLVFLGVKALRARTTVRESANPRTSPGRLFRDGFFVALLNPKTALFFAALLPQFINPGASALGQSLLLGCVFVSIAMCTDTVYVLSASALASTIRQRSAGRSYGRYLSAATFIGLGAYAALAGPRSCK
jgi:threonine/homoserine/homoserine lactone efflux protein